MEKPFLQLELVKEKLLNGLEMQENPYLNLEYTWLMIKDLMLLDSKCKIVLLLTLMFVLNVMKDITLLDQGVEFALLNVPLVKVVPINVKNVEITEKENNVTVKKDQLKLLTEENVLLMENPLETMMMMMIIIKKNFNVLTNVPLAPKKEFVLLVLNSKSEI